MPETERMEAPSKRATSSEDENMFRTKHVFCGQGLELRVNQVGLRVEG